MAAGSGRKQCAACLEGASPRWLSALTRRRPALSSPPSGQHGMNSADAIIVGGGIAGLVAAYTLKKQRPRFDITMIPETGGLPMVAFEKVPL